MTMYNALVVCFLAIPLVIGLELGKFQEYAAAHSMVKCIAILTVGGLITTAFVLLSNVLLSIGASAYCGPLGSVKLVAVVGFACLELHDVFTAINAVGFVVVVAAFAAQSHLYNRHLAAQRSKAQSANAQLEREKRLVEEDPLLRKVREQA